MRPRSYLSQAKAILERHGYAPDFDDQAPSGNVSESYFTPEVVLKIPTKGWESTARREWVSAEAAGKAGVPVAPPLAYDDRRDLVPTPYTIWRRVAGGPPRDEDPAWEHLGVSLALLHRTVRGGGYTREDRDGPVNRHLANPAVAARLQGLGKLAAVQAWADRLSKGPAAVGPVRMLHADAHRGNILAADDGRLAALVDWGDSGFGDPAYDLSRAPPAAMPRLVAAYQEAGGGLDRQAPRRILSYRLARILRWQARGGREGHDLEELLEFAETLPDAWAAFGL